MSCSVPRSCTVRHTDTQSEQEEGGEPERVQHTRIVMPSALRLQALVHTALAGQTHLFVFHCCRGKAGLEMP